MDGKTLYNIDREQKIRLEGISPLHWDELGPQDRMDWEYAAVQQSERDDQPLGDNEFIEVM